MVSVIALCSFGLQINELWLCNCLRTAADFDYISVTRTAVKVDDTLTTFNYLAGAELVAARLHHFSASLVRQTQTTKQLQHPRD